MVLFRRLLYRILYYNNWPLLKIKSTSQSRDISDSLCLKCSKSNGFSTTTPGTVLIRDTTTYENVRNLRLRP